MQLTSQLHLKSSTFNESWRPKADRIHTNVIPNEQDEYLTNQQTAFGSKVMTSNYEVLIRFKKNGALKSKVFWVVKPSIGTATHSEEHIATIEEYLSQAGNQQMETTN
jgi:hypothetical protein